MSLPRVRNPAQTTLRGLMGLLISSHISAVYASPQPFLPVETGVAVAKRQECIADYFSCADQGPAFEGTCCRNNEYCALDVNNNPGCCPNNAVCTGTVPEGARPTPEPTAITISYVPNIYFSFPYIDTYFPDWSYCTAALSQCNANYEACTSHLGGLPGGNGGYAVTIVVQGGRGTTITAGAEFSYDMATATSICHSLSSVACHGLHSDMCTLSWTTQSGFYFGTAPANAAARPTAAAAAACAGLVGAVAVGVGVGVW